MGIRRKEKQNGDRQTDRQTDRLAIILEFRKKIGPTCLHVLAERGGEEK